MSSGVSRSVRVARCRAPPHRIRRVPSRSARSGWRSTFPVAVTGMASTTRTKRGAHFVPRSGCSARKAPNATGSNSAPALELDGGHHLVAGAGVRHRVDDDGAHAGHPGEHLLDRPRREVLAVHPQPVRGAPGEPEGAVLVAVAEVAGPVPPVPPALGGGLRVGVVALERRQAVPPHDLADRFAGVQQDTPVAEASTRALDPGGRVDHRDVDAFVGSTEGAGRHPGERLDHHRPLAGAVALDHEAPEAAPELLAVARRGLRPEAPLELVVGILRALGHGEDVGQRPADVVEVGAAVPAHVGQERRGREPGSQHHAGAGVDGGEQVGEERVAVEERHGAVQDVVAREPQR